MTIRETFRPPPVLPAQAPMNIRNTSMVFDKVGHLPKLAVAKPVVVIMELTWKRAKRKLSATLATIPPMFTAIMMTAAATIPR